MVLLLLALQLVQSAVTGDAWRWAHFSASAGLPAEVVRAVVEGPDVAWAVTDGGAAWYDGVWWHPLEGGGPPAPRSLAAAELLPGGGLLVVSDGRLRIGDRSGFRTVPVRWMGESLPVTDAVPSGDGRALVVSVSRLLSVPLDGESPATQVEPPAPLQADAPLASLWRTRSGALWLSAGLGLWRSEDDGRTWRSFLPPGVRVSAVAGVAESAEGGVTSVLFPVEHRGVWTWSRGGAPQRAAGEGAFPVVGVAVTDDGRPVVAYDGARIRVRSGDGWEDVTTPLDPGQFVAGISFGPGDRFWIATDDGIHVRDGSAGHWEAWNHPFPDLRNRVHDILALPDGTVWIATSGGVERRSPGQPAEFWGEAAGVPLRDATGLARGPAGAVYVVSGAGFPGAVRFTDGAWTHLMAESAAGESLHFHRVRPGPGGELWFLGLGPRPAVGRPGGGPGIWRVDGDRLVHLPASDSLPSGRVYNISADGDAVWIATLDGLARRAADGAWTYWDTARGLALPRIFTVAADGAGGAWFGDQASGLGHVDGTGLVRYLTRADGLVDDDVWSVFIDGDALWIGTAGGLAHYDGEVFSSFRTEDGLPGLQVWPLARSGDRLLAGTVDDGVGVLHLDALPGTPRVRVDEVALAGRTARARWSVATERGLTEPRRVRTRWRLDGGAWSPWSLEREASLVEIDGGTHRFEVQARGLLDRVSPPSPEATFEVPPPLWGRVEFLAPIALLLVLGSSLLAVVNIRRREYRDALERSRELYRRFFEDDLTGDFLVGPGGRIVDCNPAFARIFGYASPAAAVGRDVGELLPDRTAFVSTLRALRDAGHLEHLQLELRARDGRTVHVVANVFGTFDADGRLRELRGYVFDETVRRKLEARLVEARRIEAVGRLAGGIAHEFNNVLAAITGYATLLLQDARSDDPRRGDLEGIVEASQRGKELTTRLLAFGRRRLVRPSVLDVNELVRGIESLLRRTCGGTCTLRTRYGLDLPSVRVDPDHLEQIVLHLVLNARDAVSRGGNVRVATAVRDVADDATSVGEAAMPGRYVVVEVSDDGRGMSEEERNRMFEPFYTTKEEGYLSAGLGLPMVYGLVRQNGGFVDVRSAPGHGTRVRVHLPALGPPADGTDRGEEGRAGKAADPVLARG